MRTNSILDTFKKIKFKISEALSDNSSKYFILRQTYNLNTVILNSKCVFKEEQDRFI